MANQLEMAKALSILTLHEQGLSNRQIARLLGIHRKTVRRHLATAHSKCTTPRSPGPAPLVGSDWASQPLTGPAPQASPRCTTPLTGSDGPAAGGAASSDASATAESSSSVSHCEPYRQIILDKLDRGLTAQRIWQDLTSDHGFSSGYHSVQRFVRRLGLSQPLPFRRIEVAPGMEVQVDFGKGAPIVGPGQQRRKTHVFRIVLSHSRKAYSEAIFGQTTDGFLGCLENAFWHFGGVTRTTVIDNLRAAVTRADWYDPDLHPRIVAFCQHYRTVILPTRPYTPRHKGKIENSVSYVQDNALKGRTFTSLAEQNRFLLHWEATVADTRIHGTIRKQVGKLFADVERPALLTLPSERLAFFHEAERSVHRDGHVEIARAYYSVPPEYLGRKVWVRWDGRVVRIFNHRFEQIALHPQTDPGRFSTHDQHIAPEKISGVERGATWLLQRASLIGPEADRWAQQMLIERGIQGLRVLQGLLSLPKHHPAEVIERACQVASSRGLYRLRAIRQAIAEDPGQQDQFEFIEQDPIIRDLTEYGQLVRAAILQGPLPAPREQAGE
jgi:transposase